MKIFPTQIDGGQKGFSLVELMIAMVLGLILLGGVIAAFVSATGSLALNREIDRSHESQRFVFNLLTDEIRQAARLGDGPFLIPIEVDDLNGESDNQKITIRYHVLNDGDAVHCDGSEVDGSTDLEKTFWVENGALRCESGPVGGPLVTTTPVDLAFGLQRIRIEEWIASPAPVPPEDFELKSLQSMGALDALDENGIPIYGDDGLGLVGVRLLVEHDHVRNTSQTFVVTVALRNPILQWFKRPL